MTASGTASMFGPEPHATAFALAVFGTLMVLSVLLSRASGRLGMPISFLFLLLGVMAGEEGLGGIHFDDYALMYRLGTMTLVLILFDGGLNTPMRVVRLAARSAAMLATVGVVATAAIVGAGAHALGYPWGHGLLLGAIVAPTDAAVVFAALRSTGTHLKKQLSAVLELESGLNDPLAVMLTGALTDLAFAGRPLGWHLAWELPWHIAVGLVAGIAVGLAGRWLISAARLSTGGLYPILTLALAGIAFGAPTLLHGSGFLAVYVASVLLGNGPMPHRASLLHVHNSVAWLAQIVMFLALGLLVTPSKLVAVAPVGLALALLLALVARPLAVALSLLPLGVGARDVATVSWIGLRGAVPIVLATFPVLVAGDAAQSLFDVVFFVVVVNALVPGSTIGWAARVLGQQQLAPPEPPAVLEINSVRTLAGDVVGLRVEPGAQIGAAPLAELSFPAGAAVLLAMRGREVIAANGQTRLAAGDHVYVFCRRPDRDLMRALCARPPTSA